MTGVGMKSLFDLTVIPDVVTERPIVPLADDVPLQEAAHRLVQETLAALPVVAADGHLVGMLSATDILGAMFARDASDFGERPVQVAMSAVGDWLVPEDTLLDALDLMSVRRLDALPVKGEAGFVGVVTWRDLANTLYQRCQEDMRQLHLRVFNQPQKPPGETAGETD